MSPRSVVALNGWCWLVLVVVNLPLVSFLGGFYVAFAAICAGPVLVVGIPAGLLLARLMRGVPSERVHVAAFALVGAVLAGPVLLLMLARVSSGPIVWDELWCVLAIATVEGAIGAGGARWWTGRRARRSRSGDDLRPMDPVQDESEQRWVP